MMNGKSGLSNGKGKAPMASTKRKQPSSSSSEKQYAVELHFNNELNTLLMLPRSNLFRDYIPPRFFLIKIPSVESHLQSSYITEYITLCENFAATHKSFPISFSSSSLTITAGVVNGHSLFLKPVPSMALKNIHEEFRRFLIDILPGADSWDPICPIGLDLPDDKLVQALNFVFSSFRFPLQGTVKSIVLVEYSSPYRIPLFSFDFRTHPVNPSAELTDDD